MTKREREHIDAYFQYWSLSPILQQLGLGFNAQSWKFVMRCVMEMVWHWTGVTVDRRCEGNTVILRHDSEKFRFKSNGQNDAINSQLETLWPYKEVRHNVINSQSKIKVRYRKIETPHDQSQSKTLYEGKTNINSHAYLLDKHVSPFSYKLDCIEVGVVMI